MLSLLLLGSMAAPDDSPSLPVAAVVAPAAADVTRVVSPTSVRVEGLLGERILAHTRNRMLGLEEGALLGGFRQRPGNHPWIGEHVGKWLHAASLLYQLTGEEALRAKLERVAQGLMACQEPDGYLGTYAADRRFGLFPGADWDVWVHKYCLYGLLCYHGVTGDEAALQASRRIGDLLIATFPSKRSILAAGTHVGMAATSVLEPIVLLYRATGDRRYLDFAEYIVGAWDEEGGPRVLSNMLEHGSVLKVGNRKAYEMLSNYVGLCELYRATGEERYLRAARLAWLDVRGKRLYLTGGSSRGELFQEDGQLPNDEGSHIQETCVTVTWMQLNWQLLRLTGEEDFAAELERTIFNQLLGAQKPDGSGFAYYCPLEGRKPYGAELHCCNSSGPRGLALAPTCVYTLDRDGVRVNLFSTSELRAEIGGTGVTVTQRTHFPDEGPIALEVRPDRPVSFALRVRVPMWATEPRATLKGKRLKVEPGGYLEIKRVWSKGDRLVLDYPFARRVHGGSGMNEGRLALSVGPLVLALDSTDNPDLPNTKLLGYAAGDAGELGLEGRRAEAERRTWPGEMVYSARAVALRDTPTRQAGQAFNVLLRPYHSAGAYGGKYAVWLWGPGVELASRSGSLLFLGEESYSDPGNVDGSVCDDDPATFRVTFNGRPQAEAWFAVSLAQPVVMTRAVYRHGHCFHDGGWYDASAGKPRLQIKRRAEGPWEDVAVFDGYPATTATDGLGLEDGQAFETRFAPVEAVAVRVIGKPGWGDNPAQAFASCAELQAFGE